MNREQKTLAICEMCYGTASTINEEGDWVWRNRPTREYFSPLGDLNAARAAVATLNDDELRRFANNLGEIVVGVNFDNYDAKHWPLLFVATPEQWCDAFIEVKGLK